MTKARSNATANAAKGDLTVGNGTNLSGVLAVGNTGDTIVADSSTSTGLRWAGNYAAGKNGLINGAADISQRGATITGISTDNTYTADRWYITRGGTIDYAQKTVAGGNNPPATFDAYLQYINQSAGNPFLTIQQTLETKDSLRFAGQTVTFSFYARAAANTAKSKSLKASVTYNTTANTKTNTIIGNTTFAINYGTAVGDWTRCTLTASVPSTAKSVGVRFVSEPAGGLAVGDGYEITGMQLENGSVMTQFETATGTIQGELAACQRYYWRVTGLGGGFAELGQAAARSTTVADQSYPLPVTMRVAPTSVDWAVNQYLSTYYGNTQYTVTSVTLDTPTTPNRACTQLAVASGLTAGTRYMNYLQNTTSAFIGFSAEL